MGKKWLEEPAASSATRRSVEPQTVTNEKTAHTLTIAETIWTENCYEYAKDEPAQMARRTGFESVAKWMDAEWGFTENLFVAV